MFVEQESTFILKSSEMSTKRRVIKNPWVLKAGIDIAEISQGSSDRIQVARGWKRNGDYRCF